MWRWLKPSDLNLLKKKKTNLKMSLPWNLPVIYNNSNYYIIYHYYYLILFVCSIYLKQKTYFPDLSSHLHPIGKKRRKKTKTLHLILGGNIVKGQVHTQMKNNFAHPHVIKNLYFICRTQKREFWEISVFFVLKKMSVVPKMVYIFWHTSL